MAGTRRARRAAMEAGRKLPAQSSSASFRFGIGTMYVTLARAGRFPPRFSASPELSHPVSVIIIFPSRREKCFDLPMPRRHSGRGGNVRRGLSGKVHVARVTLTRIRAGCRMQMDLRGPYGRVRRTGGAVMVRVTYPWEFPGNVGNQAGYSRDTHWAHSGIKEDIPWVHPTWCTPRRIGRLWNPRIPDRERHRRRFSPLGFVGCIGYSRCGPSNRQRPDPGCRNRFPLACCNRNPGGK